MWNMLLDGILSLSSFGTSGTMYLHKSERQWELISNRI